MMFLILYYSYEIEQVFPVLWPITSRITIVMHGLGLGHGNFYMEPGMSWLEATITAGYGYV